MNDEQRKWFYYAVPVVVVLGLGAALYYGRTHRQPAEPPVAAAPPAPAGEAPPQIRHPISDEPPQETPLPPLNESDAAVQDSLSGIFGRTLEPFLVPRDIVRNVVVTIDNLPRKKTAVQRWPLKPTAGEFVVSGAEDVALSDANYVRYAPLVKIVRNAEVSQLAALYTRFYPLFQEAYTDLGYPDGYFNDRLVEVIDHLLATPEVAGPIRLTQPGVFYQFADPTLEERSAGQKLLIRMGPQNAAAIKVKLRELRKAVASQERAAQ
jgi:Protein of unknown function (DUF3014)